MAERELAAAVSRQLVLVRSLLDKAKRSALEGDDIGLMSAMLLADVAVETLVKLVLFDRGADARALPSASFTIGGAFPRRSLPLVLRADGAATRNRSPRTKAQQRGTSRA